MIFCTKRLAVTVTYCIATTHALLAVPLPDSSADLVLVGLSSFWSSTPILGSKPVFLNWVLLGSAIKSEFFWFLQGGSLMGFDL